MTVNDFALQQVEEFHPVMLEHRKNIRILAERNEVRFDHDPSGVGANMARKVVLMTRAGATSLDVNSLPGFHEDGVSFFLEAAEK